MALKIRATGQLSRTRGAHIRHVRRIAPNDAPHEPEHLVKSVLFGSGRHLFLVPSRKPEKVIFERIVLAWNGSREAARALAEALPYLQKAKEVTVLVVDNEPPIELNATLGVDAVKHLKHHGINATCIAPGCATTMSAPL